MLHYSKLLVWQRSHKLVLEVYRASQSFPDAERYGLTSQLRRAALSLPTNIAEGSKRQYLILVGRDLAYIPKELAKRYLGETSELLRMLHGLREKIQGGD